VSEQKWLWRVYMTPKAVVKALREAGYPLPARHASATAHVARMEFNPIFTPGGERRYSPHEIQEFIEAFKNNRPGSPPLPQDEGSQGEERAEDGSEPPPPTAS